MIRYIRAYRASRRTGASRRLSLLTAWDMTKASYRHKGPDG